MIPYVEYQVIPIGALHIRVWGLFVALGMLAALFAGMREAKRRGLDPGIFADLAIWVIIPALIVGRLFDIVAYEPDTFLGDPWRFLRVWEGGMSSFGGFIGAAIGGSVFARRAKIPFWTYADVAGFVLPLGYGIGRIGCFLIHDHPGVRFESFFSVLYPDGPRLDHGLLLSVFSLSVFAAFLIIRARQPHPAEKGYLPMLMVCYGTVRFFLDFFRAWDLPISDRRYAFLTPAQYGSLLLVAFGLYFFYRLRPRFAVLFTRPRGSRGSRT